jgi:hypothetical protein
LDLSSPLFSILQSIKISEIRNRFNGYNMKGVLLFIEEAGNIEENSVTTCKYQPVRIKAMISTRNPLFEM